FSSRRRHTRLQGDWSSDVCSSDLDRGSPENAAALDRSGCYDFFLSGRIQSSHGAAAAMNSPGIATPATRPTIERKTSEISIMQRSEERRVGKECRCCRWAERYKKE